MACVFLFYYRRRNRNKEHQEEREQEEPQQIRRSSGGGGDGKYARTLQKRVSCSSTALGGSTIELAVQPMALQDNGTNAGLNDGRPNHGTHEPYLLSFLKSRFLADMQEKM
jgi:hypothetical protein